VSKNNQAADSTSTQWGWIAFGILAGACIVGAIVWWMRRRASNKPQDGGAPPTGTGTD
jgi:hypothetical protein